MPPDECIRQAVWILPIYPLAKGGSLGGFRRRDAQTGRMKPDCGEERRGFCAIQD